MPRACSICTHDQRPAIDAAIVGGTPLRGIARRYAVSEDALFRHRAGHLPAHLSKAKDAAEVANADDLLGRVGALETRAQGILTTAEQAGELTVALKAIREALRCLELLARLRGELDTRPVVQVGIVASPEWVQVRNALLDALGPYPAARVAVSGRLAALEVGDEHRG